MKKMHVESTEVLWAMPLVKMLSNQRSTQQSYGLSAIKSKGSWEGSAPSAVTSFQQAFNRQVYMRVYVCAHVFECVLVCQCVQARAPC